MLKNYNIKILKFFLKVALHGVVKGKKSPTKSINFNHSLYLNEEKGNYRYFNTFPSRYFFIIQEKAMKKCPLNWDYFAISNKFIAWGVFLSKLIKIVKIIASYQFHPFKLSLRYIVNVKSTQLRENFTV